jgi:hypothetical protein
VQRIEVIKLFGLCKVLYECFIVKETLIEEKTDKLIDLKLSIEYTPVVHRGVA